VPSSKNKKIENLIEEDLINFITDDDVKKYEMIFPMMKSMLEEMKTLSSKKQDGLVNTLKVKMINKLISTSRELLIHSPALDYLEELDEDLLPQNSDVVLMLSQYIEALKQFHMKNQVFVDHIKVWRTKENPNPKSSY